MLYISTILLVIALLSTISLVIQAATALLYKRATTITVQAWSVSIAWGLFYLTAHLL